MRYMIVRENGKLPKTFVWEGEMTHLQMIKKEQIPQQNISSVGYVDYDRSKKDFLITWHTPYADEVDEAKDKQDRRILIAYMRLKFGRNIALQNKMADEFEEKKRKSAEIARRFFQGKGR